MTLRHCLWFALLTTVIVTFGCSSSKPVNSSLPQFDSASSRTKWMSSKLRMTAPSNMIDAAFDEREVHHKGGHRGPANSMFWFFAKIEIDPADVAKWTAKTKPVTANRNWLRELNPLHAGQNNPKNIDWHMTPEEFDGAEWYDPVPLVGNHAHGGYVQGYMLVGSCKKYLYIWQHWR